MIQHGTLATQRARATPFHCAHTVQVIPPVPHSVDPSIEARVGA